MPFLHSCDFMLIFIYLSDLPAAGKTVSVAADAKQPVAAGGVSDADADLEARLENLKRQ